MIPENPHLSSATVLGEGTTSTVRKKFFHAARSSKETLGGAVTQPSLKNKGKTYNAKS